MPTSAHTARVYEIVLARLHVKRWCAKVSDHTDFSDTFRGADSHPRKVDVSTLRSNIAAARIVAQTLKSTLGPKRTDKMLVGSLGDITITSDGRTILDEIDNQNPVAKMMIEAAKAIGTTGDDAIASVILSGVLLSKAEDLLDQKIEPQAIMRGYRIAAEKANEVIQSRAISFDPEDRGVLKKIAMTELAGHPLETHREYLADIAVKAVLAVVEKRNTYLVNINDVRVEKKLGKSVRDTKLIQGIVIDKEIAHLGMPKRVEKAEIALLDYPLEIEITEFDAKMNIESPEQVEAFLKQEEDMLHDMIENIAKTGANVVFCQKSIGDMAQHFLTRKGILATGRNKKSDMEKIAKVTGGKVLKDLESMTSTDLGHAALVEERKIGDGWMTFIEGCKHPKIVTIIIRGNTQIIVDEAERSLYDAMYILKEAIEEPKMVGGGGATELEVSLELQRYAKSLPHNERLAVERFASALEVITSTLVENSGLDPIDVMCELRSKHERGDSWAGIETQSSTIQDMVKTGVLLPMGIESRIVKSAFESASVILNMEDVLQPRQQSAKVITLQDVDVFRVSREINGRNWSFVIPLVREVVSICEKGQLPPMLDSLIAGTMDIDTQMEEGVDKEVAVAVRTHLVYAKMLSSIDRTKYPPGIDECMKHLRRALELLEISEIVDQYSKDLSLRKLEIKDLKKIDEVDGRQVYTI